jgi:hypothetical protein
MFAKLWPQIESEPLSLNSKSSSSPTTTHDPQQKEDHENFKGGSRTRHGGDLTLTTKAVSDRGYIAADTVAEQKREQRRRKTNTK